MKALSTVCPRIEHNDHVSIFPLIFKNFQPTGMKVLSFENMFSVILIHKATKSALCYHFLVKTLPLLFLL